MDSHALEIREAFRLSLPWKAGKQRQSASFLAFCKFPA